jgi:hypothetical protein
VTTSEVKFGIGNQKATWMRLITLQFNRKTGAI